MKNTKPLFRSQCTEMEFLIQKYSAVNFFSFKLFDFLKGREQDLDEAYWLKSASSFILNFWSGRDVLL